MYASKAVLGNLTRTVAHQQWASLPAPGKVPCGAGPAPARLVPTLSADDVHWKAAARVAHAVEAQADRVAGQLARCVDVFFVFDGEAAPDVKAAELESRQRCATACC